MNQYLKNEIIKFQMDNIPILEYKARVNKLRDKINNYINKELLYLKKLLYGNKISPEEYHQLKVIVEYQRIKYYQLVNQR